MHSTTYLWIFIQCSPKLNKNHSTEFKSDKKSENKMIKSNSIFDTFTQIHRLEESVNKNNNKCYAKQEEIKISAYSGWDDGKIDFGLWCVRACACRRRVCVCMFANLLFFSYSNL